MVAAETLVLTGGIILADLVALHEYLRLDDQLGKIKASKASASPTLSDFAEEVNEPFQPRASGDSVEDFEHTVPVESVHPSEHMEALDKISEKLDDVLNSVSKVREKVTG